MKSVLEKIEDIEAVQDIEQVWPEFEAIVGSMGFRFVIYSMAYHDNSDFYYYDNTGVEDYKRPGFCDPFLQFCCDNYETTYTGGEFLVDHPYLDENAISLIKKGGDAGFISGIGVPIRLTGSDRYGGFNLGTSYSRNEFLDRYSDKTDSIRMTCVMVQRQIEKLMDKQGILCCAGQNTHLSRMSSLTDRETQILDSIARGLSRKACAEHFSLSEATVSTHIKNIYRKLGVNNRAEATRIAVQAQ